MLSPANVPASREATCAMSGRHLHIVRSGRRKLHVRTPGATGSLDNAGPERVDPPGPERPSWIAPWEQARTTQHTGRQDGDPEKPITLFHLENDTESREFPGAVGGKPTVPRQAAVPAMAKRWHRAGQGGGCTRFGRGPASRQSAVDGSSATGSGSGGDASRFRVRPSVDTQGGH